MKKENRFGVRDIVTVAAMMVLFFAFAFFVGAITLPIPLLYLYGAAGIEMFIGAVFYLVAAHRISKHGLLFIWITVYGLVTALLGYAFMLPYFIALAAIVELSMIGKGSYKKLGRNLIGWGLYSGGMMIGAVIPIWFAWSSYKEAAIEGGFSSETLMMQYEMGTNSLLLLIGVVISVVLGCLGILFGQTLLRKHFKKAGIVE